MPEDSPAGRQRLEQALEERRGLEEGEEFKPIRRGWCLGEEKFRAELQTQMIERMGWSITARSARRRRRRWGGSPSIWRWARAVI